MKGRVKVRVPSEREVRDFSEAELRYYRGLWRCRAATVYNEAARRANAAAASEEAEEYHGWAIVAHKAERIMEPLGRSSLSRREFFLTVSSLERLREANFEQDD